MTNKNAYLPRYQTKLDCEYPDFQLAKNVQVGNIRVDNIRLPGCQVFSTKKTISIPQSAWVTRQITQIPIIFLFFSQQTEKGYPESGVCILCISQNPASDVFSIFGGHYSILTLRTLPLRRQALTKAGSSPILVSQS